mgnify:CR=1 FL=1|jgi:DNA-binding transcriptional MerR regulator
MISNLSLSVESPRMHKSMYSFILDKGIPVSLKQRTIRTLSKSSSVNLRTLFLKRTQGEKRLFSNADMQWIQLIECLRNTGMPISKVKHYVELCLQGDETIKERLNIIKEQEAIMKQQLQEMRKHLKLLQFKKDYYKQQLKDK